jgi:anaerobic selenocysteine-containing dehydrogenase
MQEYCENGAKHINDEATTRRITREFFQQYPLSKLARKSDLWLNQQGALTEPMVKWPGSDYCHPIGWDQAFDLLATELSGLDSPDEALFYTSGRLKNEAAFLAAAVRACLRHQQPARLQQHVPRVQRLGAGGDARHRQGQREPEAGLIRFKNPQTVRGVLGRGTVIADQFLHIKLCGDLALFQAINALVLQAEQAAPGTVLDHEFINTYTTGFAEFAQHAKRLSWSDVVEAMGLSREEIEQVVTRVLATKKIIVCWAMGVTQQKYGVPTIREIVNVLMLRGALGRPGAGVCPVRGHSNVQGDRTMGIWEQMPQSFLDALQHEFGFTRRRNTAWTPSIRSEPCVMGGPSSSSGSRAISCARRRTATRPSRPCESAGLPRTCPPSSTVRTPCAARRPSFCRPTAAAIATFRPPVSSSSPSKTP